MVDKGHGSRCCVYQMIAIEQERYRRTAVGVDLCQIPPGMQKEQHGHQNSDHGRNKDY